MTRNGLFDKDINLTRRTLLKGAAFGLLAGATARLLPTAGPAFAAVAGSPSSLVVYYTRTGNTRAVAGFIREQTGGDVLPLDTAAPYPEEYRALTEQAKKELESGYKPALKTPIPSLADYDVVFVGSPCWWGTIATPVITFLTEADLSGKTIAPFMTHEGSGLGRSVAHIRELCPKSTVREGLAVRGSRAASSQDEVAAWLREIGVKK